MPNWVANHLTIRGDNAIEILQKLLTECTEENEVGCLHDFDFNKIIQMPENLKIESSSKTDSCVEMYLTSINPIVNYYGKDKKSADEYMALFQKVQASKSYGEYNDKLSVGEIRLREQNTYMRNENDEVRKMTKKEILALGKQAVDNVLTYGSMDWYDWSIKHWGTKWNAYRTQIPDPDIAEVYFDTAWSPVPQIMLALTEQYPEFIFDYEYAEEQPGYFAGHYLFEGGRLVTHNIYDTDSKENYEMCFKLWGCEDEFKFNEKTGTYEYIKNEKEML